MKLFLSCDWGTSAFRLRLVNAENASVLSEIKTNHGIAAAFERWRQINRPEKSRIAFYQAYLFEQVKKISGSFSGALEAAPIILSGMPSSSIGMMELPYKEIPFRCDGTDLEICVVAGGDEYPNKLIMISGAKTENDVIRGEETMLTGVNCLNSDHEQLFIFPGTHSKHLTVKNGLVKNITTYMTGELFDLLSNKSILSDSVKKIDQQQTDKSQFFLQGVNEGARSTLANNIFHVRTNQLFRKATQGENYDFLSGLLIGHELKDVSENKPAGILLVCGEELRNAYLRALDVLELSDCIQSKNADEALVNGHWKIMKQLGYL